MLSIWQPVGWAFSSADGKWNEYKRSIYLFIATHRIWLWMKLRCKIPKKNKLNIIWNSSIHILSTKFPSFHSKALPIWLRPNDSYPIYNSRQWQNQTKRTTHNLRGIKKNRRRQQQREGKGEKKKQNKLREELKIQVVFFLTTLYFLKCSAANNLL